MNLLDLSKLPVIARLAGLSVFLTALCGAVVYATRQTSAPASMPLAGFAPPGALLAIESPDFAGLLRSWTNAPEQRRWLAGDNYAAFSRSRLFDRLGQAQSEFAATAGLAPDAGFLQQIAGRQSLFAWYGIGNLEFLYITRLPSGNAAKTPLLQLRDKFEQRTVGPDTFFVRSQTDPARTVAFAIRGDYLLLATREDLLAGALQRMQKAAARSLLRDPWYANSVAAASAQPGDLRMTLNLASIVPSPYFRSYWIQQNITELKRYTAAISDLYRSSGYLREERVLLPANPSTSPASSDLSPVLNYLPADIGVYRAAAQPAPQQVIDEIEDKLLARQPGADRNPQSAPVADLATPIAGDVSNLEQRIDEPVTIQPTRAAELAPLRDLLDAVRPTAMLVFSTATALDKPQQTIFIPIHSAVVVVASLPWTEASLEHSLNSALAPRITVGRGGLNWSPHHNAIATWYTLEGAKPLALALNGNECLLATDEATLLQLLAASHNAVPAPRIASTIAGFSLASERAPFADLTMVLDQPGKSAQLNDSGGKPPSFFSGNINSLGFTFKDLASETFTESPAANHNVRQSVLYQWQH